MHPDLARRLFRLALNEKVAFVPATAEATGPGGQPVPQGAPPAGDPNAAPPAGAMDPQGAPPGGPAGAPPMDPQASAPAVDPSADPAMAQAAAGGAPPAPEPAPGGAPQDPMSDTMAGPPGAGPDPSQDPGKDPSQDAMVPVSAVVGIIEAMKGRRTAEAEVKAEKAQAGGGDLPPEAAAGPITGLPMGGAPGIQGPLKMASVLKRAMGLPVPGSTPPAPAAPGAGPAAPVQPAMSSGTPPTAGQPQGTLTAQVLARAQAQRSALAPQLAGAQQAPAPLPAQHPT